MGLNGLSRIQETPQPGEDVFILANSEAGLCVSTENSIFSNQTINNLSIGQEAGNYIRWRCKHNRGLNECWHY